MLSEEVVQGMRVRYPRTGTAGTILRIERIRGEVFAELDSTNLLYRIDQLIPASSSDKKTTVTISEDAKKIIEREQAFAAGNGMTEALKNIDQSCEGGG
ncbi:MAG: DUF2098 domain-containing protein [Methanomicrobiales archaeon HGW-Methanomicrobiales-1]|jgi:hypothetical protein|nr:MAG: DUF2098 domain-containing protein [Methanomicrobiales archaeon HGW-Methanomicrobiales-1]